MTDKMKITIEILNTGLEEDILRKGEWEDDSLFGRSLRNALMHFTKESFCLDKIRAEIENTMKYQYAIGENQYAEGFEKSLEIIDKYKAESEET